MPKKLRSYVALAEEHDSLPAYAVLLNILPSGLIAGITDRYEISFLGMHARQVIG